MSQGIPLPSDAHSVNFAGDQEYINDVEIANDNLLEVAQDDELGVEYPNVPEISQMGTNAPAFFKALLPNLKSIMTSNDLGKAEIFESAFKDDPRWGSIYQDKFGLPMIVWNKLPYYVNKPGFSGTDLNTFTGEMIKYMPATKYASGAKGIIGTIARGVPAYATTEVVAEGTSAFVTPRATKTQERSIGDVGMDVGTMTGIGVGADVLMPPAIKYGAKTLGYVAKATGLDAAGRKIVEMVLPKFTPEVLAGPLARELKGGDEIIEQQSKYPLTQGQRTADAPVGVGPKQTEQLGVEDVLRQSASDDLGTTIIRGFDDSQLSQIRADVFKLQDEFGAGLAQKTDVYGNVPQQAGEAAQNIVIREADRIKSEAGEAYDFVKNVAIPPRMTREGVVTIAEDMLKVIPDNFAPSQLVEGPLLREITQLKRLVKLAKDPKFKDQTLQNVHGYQKRLNTAIGQAERSSPEERALLLMKKILDESVYDGIEKGFIYGDQEILDQLAGATGLYRDFMRLTGRSTGKNSADKASNRILEQISNNDYTPLQVTNLLFGHSKFTPNQALPLVIAKLQKSLPEAEFMQIKALLKDGVLTKAFSGRNGEVTRTAIINNFNDVFVKQKAVIKELFTPNEIKRIEQFRKDVLPTLWAEIKLNPSGTGYTMLGALARQQLLTHPILRVGGEKVVKAVDASKKASQGIDAVRQTIDRFQTPLLSNLSQSILRPMFRTESSMENVLEIPDSTIENLRNKMNEFGEAMPNLDQPAFEFSEDVTPMNPPSFSVNPNTTSMNVPAFPAPMATDDPTTRMALAGDNPDNQLIARRGIASLA